MSKGAVAAGHPETVSAARSILDNGGNAYDAVLASAAMACVAEPVLASLGGGGFLLAKPADQSQGPVLYDFFAQTPKRRKPMGKPLDGSEGPVEFHPILANFGTVTQEFHIGAGSVATPGMVPGIFAIYDDLCTMPLGEILRPAIERANSGVSVTAFQAYLFSVVEAIYIREPESLGCYGSPGGGLAKEGDVICNPQLADTLETLASEGEDLFRVGEIARSICTLCDQFGSHLSADDLQGYQVERRQPLIEIYRGAKIITNPGPSTGGVLIAFALKLLERLNISKVPLSNIPYGSGEYYDLLAQVMAATNSARIKSDQGDLHHLLDDKLLAHYEQRILGRPASHRGTTHISIIDAKGNAAAMTLSNGEGCAHMVPGAGFMLNNMLGEEDINPLGFHNWPENTRLSSMMAPTMIETTIETAIGHEDHTLTVLGSGGSNRIRTALLQVILNLIDQNMDLASAIDAPRIHYENDMLNIEVADEFTAIDELRARYEGVLPVMPVIPWDSRNMFFGGVHAVSVLNCGKLGAQSKKYQEFHAMGDQRRNGACSII